MQIIIYLFEIGASLIMLTFVLHETKGLFGHYRTVINQLLSYAYAAVSMKKILVMIHVWAKRLHRSRWGLTEIEEGFNITVKRSVLGMLKLACSLTFVINWIMKISCLTCERVTICNCFLTIKNLSFLFNRELYME